MLLILQKFKGKNMISKRKLGNTSEKVSEIGLGCMLMGTRINEKESFQMLDYYNSKGGNFLDTANCYAWWEGSGQFNGEESELTLGKWIKERKNRKEVFLSTKVGARLPDPSSVYGKDGQIQWEKVRGAYEYLKPSIIRKGIEDSLKRLQTDYIDLYFLHVDDRSVSQEEVMYELNELVKQGKVRYIACSNFKTWRMVKANTIAQQKGWSQFVAIQQQYSFLQPKPGTDFGISEHADQELFDYIETEKNITLIAYSPLLKGIFDEKVRENKSWVWNSFDWEGSMSRITKVQKLAKDLNITVNQLVYSILLHENQNIIPLVGTSNWNQLTENIESVKIKLSPDHLKYLYDIE